MASIRAARARAHGLGSAKSGTRDFWLQRVTSVLGLPLTLGLIIIIANTSGRPYDEVSANLRSPAVVLLFLLGIVNFCVHMQLGMKTIIEDYVHHSLVKELFLVTNIGFSTAVAIAAALASLTIYFRG